MLKLIKILNSGVNVPEPVTLKKNTDKVFTAGEAVSLSGGVAVSADPAEKPEYVTLGAAEAGENKVCCYAVGENMLFDIKVDEAELYEVGSSVSLAEDDSGAICTLGAPDSTGGATVVRAEAGFVTVKF